MLSNKLTFFIALVLTFSVIAWGEPTSKTVAIRSGGNFCLLLPPKPGGGIADNEDRSISFCRKAIGGIPYTKVFPSGFIQSAHYSKQTDRYVQVTGRIDRDAYDLDEDDDGGQNDPQAPVDALCQGWPYFVQLIEPNENIFCLRCCKYKKNCPTFKSEAGCRNVIRGNYD